MPSHKLQIALLSIAAALLLTPTIARAQKSRAESAAADAEVKHSFENQIQPLLKKFCLRCHNADNMESGIRVDRLNGTLEDRHLKLWKNIQSQLTDENMPPADEVQPTADERKKLVEWIGQALVTARSRPAEKNGSVRRLTVEQYRNTLRDLLKLGDDLIEVLPPDTVSRDGFANNQQTMLLSPLLLEAHFNIADEALDRCIVDENAKPSIQDFRMDLGAHINPEPCPDKLILGALSHLLKNDDFIVTQPVPQKPFPFNPVAMQTKFRFIEGYQGNDTVRGWREYDSIYHAVFACMRGMEGYPKGEAYETVPQGLLLRPAIPSAEIFQVESTYGPRANFKISLRQLPDLGRFRVTVKAAKYNDALLLDPGAAPRNEQSDTAVTLKDLSQPQSTKIKTPGIYQIDVYPTQPAETKDESKDSQEKKKDKQKNKPSRKLFLQLGNRHFSGTLTQPAFLVVRLPEGDLKITTHFSDNAPPDHIVLTPLNETEELARKFQRFEQRLPHIGVHVGLRRDCGSTLTQVGEPQTVTSTELADYVFEGAIANYPNPDVEKDNVNYLAGVREIGVRSEYTDGRDMPRLLIRSVEFEGPYYETWPPATHRNIFIESEDQHDPPAYAADIIRTFATRAFRRPVTDSEQASLMQVWQSSFNESRNFRQSIKDTLTVVLTSPQFLFLIEDSKTPDPEPLNDWELASKLSYFLWNTAPDRQLLDLAAANDLRPNLDVEISRMIRDPRFRQFMHEFTSQWLRLDKFDVVETNRERYPRLTAYAKHQLRREPVEFLNYLIQNNRPLHDLIESDFVLANEVVATYYGLGDRTESGFAFVPIEHHNQHLGGVLTQAGILAGLSDGRESNPVKRGAWLARKIIAEPPDDPPPNVPALPEDDGEHLTLRQKIERHRNQKGCAKCHGGIDPWGIPFEQFDAGGLFKTGVTVDASSLLPDGTEVADMNGLKHHLAGDRLDQVAFSVLKHLASYAVGRSLSYNEIEFLKQQGLQLRKDEYRMQDMLRFVIQSNLFLEK